MLRLMIMKICVATSSFPSHVGDTLRAPFLPDAIATLRAQGHDVHVVTPGPGKSDGFAYPVTYFPWSGGSGDNAAGLLGRPVQNFPHIVSLLSAGARALKQAARRERFDAILCCWAVPAGFWARAAGLPYTVWCLGSDVNALKKNPATRAILRMILRGARARFADGFQLAEEVQRISGKDCGFLPTIRVLPNVGRESVASERTELLYIGRHDSVKGTDLLIDAYLEVARDFPRARLLVAGAGPLSDSLRAKVNAAYPGAEAPIQFLGKVPDEALPSLYMRAAAVVIPSRSESIPLVLGEAVQAAKPLIVTDVGDMGRLVREHQLGAVASEPSAPAIAQTLRDFLRGGVSVSATGQAKVLALLSFEKSASTLVSALRDA